MYRFLSRTVFAGRIPSLCVYEPCPVKCETVSRVFSGVGVNALSTSSFRLCEKKDLSRQGETESSQTKVKREEEPAALKVDDGGTSHQEAGDKAEQVSSKPEQVKTDKSVKENLLRVLGSMKVEVSSQMKLRNRDLAKTVKSVEERQSKPTAMESTLRMFRKATEEVSKQSETLDPKLVAAAAAAASTLPNSRQAESELLKKLRQRKALTEAPRKDATNIGEIIADMTVQRRRLRQPWMVNQIRLDEDGQGYKQVKGDVHIRAKSRNRQIFSPKRLNIFSPAPDKDVAKLAVAKPTLWDIEFAKELSQVSDLSPSNRLDEMIQWTREGKLWQYPINNESGLEEEASVPFQEHIFLEEHLKEGFPAQGPVRHFMELVVVGLSRNPYMSVQEKKEHIAWFRDYFRQKEEFLN